MNLTLAITTYNRFNYLRESFEQVIDHPRITEIILMDDASDPEIFHNILGLKELSSKIKVVRQARNRGMGYNKYTAVGRAANDWVILFDSDNVLTPGYVDALPKDLMVQVIYQPDFAKPNFDFTKYRGGGYRADKIRSLIKEPMFNTMLNACNYVVNRDQYLSVYQENADHKASDTIWMAYLWLNAGNGFYVVRGMEYDHRVHPSSGFLQDAPYNMIQAEKVRKLIMAL